jgi:pRiA4b ORF-3-like protein
VVLVRSAARPEPEWIGWRRRWPKGSGPRIVCTAGENACARQDVGGEGGYASFLEAIADPHHALQAHARGFPGFPEGAMSSGVADPLQPVLALDV